MIEKLFDCHQWFIWILLINISINIYSSSSLMEHHNNSHIGLDAIIFPNKPISGFPESLKCDISIYHHLRLCEVKSQQKWEISIDEYFYETKEFCCFVWDSMDCEIEITALCSKEYSKILETNTHETFTKVCANNVGCGYKSSCCSWDKNTRNQFALVCSLLIIAIGLLVLFAGCTIKYFQAKNKLKMLPEPKLKRATSLPTGFTKGVQGKDLVRTGSLPTRLNPNMPTPNIPAITRPQITSPVITKPTIPAISDDDVSTVQRLMLLQSIPF